MTGSAKQTGSSKKELDCFVASLLAMMVVRTRLRNHGMSGCGLRIGAGVALCVALLPGAASAQPADTVLFNGKILTVDADFSIKQALAIGSGRVLATGSSA